MAQNIDINQVIEQCKKVLTQEYLCFDGRMSKRDFWMFMVPVLIANCVLSWTFIVPLALGRIFTYVPRIPGKFSLYAMNTASAGDDPDAVRSPILNLVFKVLIVVLIIQIILFIWVKFFHN